MRMIHKPYKLVSKFSDWWRFRWDGMEADTEQNMDGHETSFPGVQTQRRGLGGRK